MRLIRGSLRGKRLELPSPEHARPTSARVRESLFNIIQHRFHINFTQVRVVDMYAGSGLLGLEAYSRGAGFILFVEKAPKVLAVLRRNITACRADSHTDILKYSWVPQSISDPFKEYPSFDLIFADPPYAEQAEEWFWPSLESLSCLQQHTLVILETAAAALDNPKAFRGAALQHCHKIGPAALWFYQKPS